MSRAAPYVESVAPSRTPCETERDSRVRALVNAHFDTVWRSLRRFGVPLDAVDDGAQQVFLVASRRLDEIRSGGERTYLLGIAIRVASEARRALKRRREDSSELVELVDPRPTPEQQLDQKRALQLFDRLVSSMPYEHRTVFVLFEIEGLTLPEIASAERIPLGTATSRLRRARELFRTLSAGVLGDGEEGQRR